MQTPPIEEDVQIGDVRLIRGDCLQVMPLLDAGSVDMVFADLPYNIAKHLPWDKEPFGLDLFNKNITRTVKHTGCLVATSSMRFAHRLLAAVSMPMHHDLVWHKNMPSNPFQAKRQPLSYHEHVLIFCETNPVYNPQMRPESMRAQVLNQPRTFKAITKKFFGDEKQNTRNISGPMYPKSVLEGLKNRGARRTLHPTQKPVALLEWLISTYTHQADMVLDPAAGSGTTAIAALNTGRKAICIEQDKGYFDIMVKRVRQHHAEMMAKQKDVSDAK